MLLEMDDMHVVYMINYNSDAICNRFFSHGQGPQH